MSSRTTSDRARWRAPILGDAQVLDLPAGRIVYYDVGSGPALMFVHGLLVNANLWRKVVERLAPDFRCIVLELPLGAHALPLTDGAESSPRSVARMIIEAVEELDLDGVTLIGNDTGGALCQMVVTTDAERIGRLILTSCDYRDNFPPRPFGYFKLAVSIPGAVWALLQPMRFRLPRRLPIAFGWLTKRSIDREAEDSYALPAIADSAIRRDVNAFVRALSTDDTNAAADKLGGFLEPVLVAWAAEDKVFPIHDAQRVAADLPNSRLAMVEDAYTFSMEDNPDELAQLISGFVREPTRVEA